MTNSQALIIAVAIMVVGIIVGKAQQVGQTSPNLINGCIFYTNPPGTGPTPLLSNGQSYVFTCDSTGKLRTTTSF